MQVWGLFESSALPPMAGPELREQATAWRGGRVVRFVGSDERRGLVHEPGSVVGQLVQVFWRHLSLSLGSQLHEVFVQEVGMHSVHPEDHPEEDFRVL